ASSRASGVPLATSLARPGAPTRWRRLATRIRFSRHARSRPHSAVPPVVVRTPQLWSKIIIQAPNGRSSLEPTRMAERITWRTLLRRLHWDLLDRSERFYYGYWLIWQ